MSVESSHSVWSHNHLQKNLRDLKEIMEKRSTILENDISLQKCLVGHMRMAELGYYYGITHNYENAPSGLIGLKSIYICMT